MQRCKAERVAGFCSYLFLLLCVHTDTFMEEDKFSFCATLLKLSHHGDGAKLNAGILAGLSEAQQGARICAQTIKPSRHTVYRHGNEQIQCDEGIEIKVVRGFVGEVRTRGYLTQNI